MPPYLCYRNFTLHSDCLGIVTFPENIQICILKIIDKILIPRLTVSSFLWTFAIFEIITIKSIFKIIEKILMSGLTVSCSLPAPFSFSSSSSILLFQAK